MPDTASDAIRRIAGRMPERIRTGMRACPGPHCLGAMLPRELFHNDRSKHCIVCCDYLSMQAAEKLLRETSEQYDRSMLRRQRVLNRARDIDQIRLRAAGDRSL